MLALHPSFVFRLAAGVGAAITLATASVTAWAAGSVERMYVLECGQSKTKDVSANWSPGVNVGVAPSSATTAT